MIPNKVKTEQYLLVALISPSSSYLDISAFKFVFYVKFAFVCKASVNVHKNFFRQF